MERSFEKQTQMSNKQQAFNNRMQAAAEETRAFKQRLEKDVEQMRQEVKALPQTIVIDTSQVRAAAACSNTTCTHHKVLCFSCVLGVHSWCARA
eukprot:43670-Eustigmatos_ZCMA.PRE.1